MKLYLMLLATIVALSVSYYFAIALPANNKARLEFEKEKYRNEQAALKAKEVAQEQEQQRSRLGLASCLAEADRAYYHDVALNGTRNGTVYSVDQKIAAVIAKRRTDAQAECHRQFGL